MIYFLAFLNSFILIALRAFQQKNVMKDKYALIPIGSFGMAICEVFIITHVAIYGLGLIILPIGLGATLGCWTAMYLHKKIK